MSQTGPARTSPSVPRPATRTLLLAVFSCLSAVCLSAVCFSAAAQTGDARGTVAEPTIPAICSVVTATESISAGVPSGESLTTTAPDTARLQAALTACASNKAVELSASGANNAFLTGPLAIPKTVTLLVDGGVTVFASRNPADYQVSGSQDTCGVVGTHGDGCYALLYLGEASLGAQSSGTNANLMGYGVINGRGGEKLIAGGALQTYSWWDLSNNARSPSTAKQNNPVMVQLYKDTSSSIYKITLINAPTFNVRNSSSGNWTVWGIKIITPWTARNTDGVDPTGVTNATITNSVIGDGDDEVALSGSTATSAITIANVVMPSGHGISIGSSTANGVSNVLANNIAFQGQAADPNQIALRIKSSANSGGTVSAIEYKNICIQNVATPIVLDPFYSSGGSTPPTFSNIIYANIHVLAGVTPIVSLAGTDASHLSTVSFDNIVFDAAPNFSPAWSETTVTYSNAISGTATPQIYPASLGTQSGTDVTYTGSHSVSNANALSCTGKFPALVGELYGVAGTTTYPNALAVTIPATVTLNAVVEPVNSQTVHSDTYSGSTYTNASTVAAAPTGTVQFLEGATVVGTATLGANGTLATASLTNPTAGTHTYTANIQADTHYAAQTFGSFTVTVTAGPAAQLAFATAPAASLVYGNSAGTVTVALQDAAGDATTSTAAVTLTVTKGGVTVATYGPTAAVSGTASFNVTGKFAVGSYIYTATANGVTAAAANQSVTPATLTVNVTAASRLFDAANNFTYTFANFVNGDTASVVSGAPSITTTALRTSAPGVYPTSATTGTLSAANYNFLLNGSTLTITGGAAQQIYFAALPSFPHGATYQLAARTSSGLAPTYTVTGPAAISGASLTVTGAGSVTVTAASAANADYAAATSVARTFTAR